MTVFGGTGATGSGNYAQGATVSISAGTPPSGQKFKNWTTSSSGVTFANANSAATTFTMPGNDVTVAVIFEAVSTPTPTYAVTVSGGTGATGGGNYTQGATVSISAGTPPSGQTFKNWTTSNSGVTFANANSAATTFTMPGNAVTVTAVFVAVFVDDRDGKAYGKVVIGSQTWMAENLNYETAGGNGSWCYNNSVDSCSKYGRLYDWSTAMGGASSSNTTPSGVQGVCPSGWHLPSRAEWGALAIAAGGTGTYGSSGTAAVKLKSKSGWNNNGNGTDDFEFSALPGGVCYSDGSFSSGNYGGWWAATEYTSDLAYRRDMSSSKDHVEENYYTKRGYGYSVRCVED